MLAVRELYTANACSLHSIKAMKKCSNYQCQTNKKQQSMEGKLTLLIEDTLGDMNNTLY